MSGSFLSPMIKSAVERFSGATKTDPVRVDRDVLRTTLIQCEFEVREMHRLLEATPEFGSHRISPPSSRY